VITVLNLIYGHSGSGKTGLIYKMMLEGSRANRRSYLIVPEQETVVCERRLLDILPPSAQLNSEVLNFSRLANLVFRHYGGLSYNYADKACKTLIMWKNLRELSPLLSEYSNGKGGVRSAEEMLSAIGELKAYCVSPTKLEKAAQKLGNNPVLQSKLTDLSLIMSAYSNNLEESYSDAADDLSRLTLKLKDHDFFKGADVYIASFTSFTR
jgi:ATP-dependent helicase/nuclease subunit B